MEVRQQFGWGTASKLKAQKPKQSNIFQIKTSFFESYAADHWMSTRTLIVRQLTNSNFHSYT